MSNRAALEALLEEKRIFPPAKAFASRANVLDPAIYEEAEDFEAFWAGWAEDLHWFRKWDRVLEWTPPYAKWFVGGKLNACYNCVDRHAEGPRRDKTALIWEGERGERKTYTYWQPGRGGRTLRQRAQDAGCAEGRPCRHLSPDDPGGGHRDARLCQDRGAPLRGVRRIQSRLAGGSNQRRAGAGADHGRRRLPARQDRLPEAQRGRRGCAVPDHPARRGGCAGWPGSPSRL